MLDNPVDKVWRFTQKEIRRLERRPGDYQTCKADFRTVARIEVLLGTTARC